MLLYKLLCSFKIVGAIKDVTPKSNIFQCPSVRPSVTYKAPSVSKQEI